MTTLSLRKVPAALVAIGLFVACGGSSQNGFGNGQYGNTADSGGGGSDATVNQQASPQPGTGSSSSGGGNSSGSGSSGGSACTISCQQDSDCSSCTAPTGGGILCCDTGSKMCFPMNVTTCPVANDGGNGGS
jgi:hypothetical protein